MGVNLFALGGGVGKKEEFKRNLLSTNMKFGLFSSALFSVICVVSAVLIANKISH